MPVRGSGGCPIMARVSRVFGVVDVCAVRTPQSGGRGECGGWSTSGRCGARHARAPSRRKYFFRIYAR